MTTILIPNQTQDVIIPEELDGHFEIIDMGIQDANYVRPCGNVYSNLTRMVMGVGTNPNEAFEDCLTQMARGAINVAPIRDWTNSFFKGSSKATPCITEGGASLVKNPTYVVCIRF